MVIKIEKLTNLVKCKYCDKGFVSERTLAVHLCEPARRDRQRNETGVQFGYRIWVRFIQRNTNKKTLTYEEFAASPFYSAFVKFGQYLIQIQCVNVEEYSEYIINSKIKLDHWCKDQHYTAWLVNYIKHESATKALERSIKSMTAWAEEHNTDFNCYFLKTTTAYVVKDIINGRISPWVIYQSHGGKEFLTKINEEQLGLIFNFIDPIWWTSRFSNLNEDTEFVKEICDNGKV